MTGPCTILTLEPPAPLEPALRYPLSDRNHVWTTEEIDKYRKEYPGLKHSIEANNSLLQEMLGTDMEDINALAARPVEKGISPPLPPSPPFPVPPPLSGPSASKHQR